MLEESIGQDLIFIPVHDREEGNHLDHTQQSFIKISRNILLPLMTEESDNLTAEINGTDNIKLSQDLRVVFVSYENSRLFPSSLGNELVSSVISK